MTPEELRAILKELDLSQLAAARFLGVNERTLRHWVSDREARAVPRPIAMLLRTMRHQGLDAEAVKALGA
jgi:DNA-binding transcriptional regulator YiaG